MADLLKTLANDVVCGARGGVRWFVAGEVRDGIRVAGRKLKTVVADAVSDDPKDSSLSCTGCGAVCAKGAKFCSSCGTELPVVKPAPAKPKFCPSCGSAVDGGKFCGSCGSALQ